MGPNCLIKPCTAAVGVSHERALVGSLSCSWGDGAVVWCDLSRARCLRWMFRGPLCLVIDDV